MFSRAQHGEPCNPKTALYGEKTRRCAVASVSSAKQLTALHFRPGRGRLECDDHGIPLPANPAEDGHAGAEVKYGIREGQGRQPKHEPSVHEGLYPVSLGNRCALQAPPSARAPRRLTPPAACRRRPSRPRRNARGRKAGLLKYDYNLHINPTGTKTDKTATLFFKAFIRNGRVWMGLGVGQALH